MLPKDDCGRKMIITATYGFDLTFGETKSLTLFNMREKKQPTWKKAIPKETPAIIPRLDSNTLVTSEKQP